MIRNERQYRITRARSDEIVNTIGELERAPLPDGLQPEMRTLQLDALRGTLVDLQSELGEFDALHDTTLIEATGIAQLPVALIRARIASGSRSATWPRESASTNKRSSDTRHRTSRVRASLAWLKLPTRSM